MSPFVYRYWYLFIPQPNYNKMEKLPDIRHQIFLFFFFFQHRPLILPLLGDFLVFLGKRGEKKTSIRQKILGSLSGIGKCFVWFISLKNMQKKLVFFFALLHFHYAIIHSSQSRRLCSFFLLSIVQR